MKILTLAFLSLLSVCAAADNIQGFYLGGGGGLIRFEDEASEAVSLNDVELSAVELLGGYKYNSALGIEVRAGANLNERTTTIGGVDREVAIDHYESIYYRPELTNPEAKLYALIGYSQVEQSSSTDTSDEVSDSVSGLSYGIGVGFTMNPDFNFNIEYRRLIDESDFEINIAGINIDYRF
jgi:opacity protein-like surface antigen